MLAPGVREPGSGDAGPGIRLREKPWLSVQRRRGRRAVAGPGVDLGRVGWSGSVWLQAGATAPAAHLAPPPGAGAPQASGLSASLRPGKKRFPLDPPRPDGPPCPPEPGNGGPGVLGTRDAPFARAAGQRAGDIAHGHCRRPCCTGPPPSGLPSSVQHPQVGPTPAAREEASHAGVLLRP